MVTNIRLVLEVVIGLALGLGWDGFDFEFAGFSVIIIQNYFLCATLQLCVNSRGPIKFMCPKFEPVYQNHRTQTIRGQDAAINPFSRYLEWSKFRISVTWSVSERDSASTDQIPRQSDNTLLRYWRNMIFNMAAVRHFNLQNFDILSRDRFGDQNLRLHTKFHRNRMTAGWDIAIKPFSKWRPSAILDFWNLVLLSRDMSLSVFLLLRTKFRVNRAMKCWDIAKNDFQYDGRPLFWICKILILYHVTVLGTIIICVCKSSLMEIGWGLKKICCFRKPDRP